MSGQLLINDVVMLEGQGVGATVVPIGLVLSDGFVAWGDCVDVRGVSAESLQSVIAQTIEPILKGEPLTSFKQLCEPLDHLTETVVMSETTQPPAPTGVSRRNLLRVSFEEQLPPPITKEYKITRPIAASIRYGVSKALLAALAHSTNRLPMRVIADEYDLPLANEPIPAYVALSPRQMNSVKRIAGYKPGALLVSYPGDDPVHELGEKAQFSHRYTRMMREAVEEQGTPETYNPLLIHDIKGAYTTIIGESVGKSLGRLSGLDVNGRPYKMRVIDPFDLPTRDEQIAKLKKLVELMRLRVNMSLQIIAHNYVDSLEAVGAFIEEKATHHMLLNPMKIGSLHAIVASAKLCHDAGVGVVLGGSSAETLRSAYFSTQVALAIQPDLMLAKPASLVGLANVKNEMLQALFELRCSGKNAV